jgi:thioredoxin 1
MSENILTLTKSSFDSEIKKDGTPILVDFWAEWCGPCRMVTPVLEELAREYAGRVRIGKVNVDEEGSLAEKFGVQSIPTLLLFKGGRVVGQQVGAAPKDVLARMFDQHLG